MSRNLVLTLGLVMLVVGLAGCGGSRITSVFAVKKGMTKQQVQNLVGSPYHSGPSCWLYHATKKGTSIDGMRVCFTHGRVSLVQTSVHL